MAKKPVKRGRKLSLDARRSKHILRAISHGLTLKRAAQAAGVTYSTLSRWMKKGRRDDHNDVDTIFRSFYIQVKYADARAEDAQAAMIHKTAKKVWTAAAWWLERRHPERWGKLDRQPPVAKQPQGVLTGQRTALPSPEELLERLVEVMGKDAALSIIAGIAAGQKRIGSNGTNGDEHE